MGGPQEKNFVTKKEGERKRSSAGRGGESSARPFQNNFTTSSPGKDEGTWKSNQEKQNEHGEFGDP